MGAASAKAATTSLEVVGVKKAATGSWMLARPGIKSPAKEAKSVATMAEAT